MGLGQDFDAWTTIRGIFGGRGWSHMKGQGKIGQGKIGQGKIGQFLLIDIWVREKV